jgi:hypothetical protein
MLTMVVTLYGYISDDVYMHIQEYQDGGMHINYFVWFSILSGCLVKVQRCCGGRYSHVIHIQSLVIALMRLVFCNDSCWWQ